jgi:hypothetical protein
MDSGGSAELGDSFPFVTDYLQTIFFPQGGNIYGSFEEAFAFFLDSNRVEERASIIMEFEQERRNFYENFTTAEEQVKAFSRLGGAASTEEALMRFLPAP